MSKYQRRHYEGMAKLLGECEAPDFQVQSFCEFFAQDNSSFHAGRFKQAVKDNWGKPFKFN
tara:strand:+ start:1980 stop:2162 length:183 start_codon:yes stop_codon:yes gene_type:complete